MDVNAIDPGTAVPMEDEWEVMSEPEIDIVAQVDDMLTECAKALGSATEPNLDAVNGALVMEQLTNISHGI